MPGFGKFRAAPGHNRRISRDSGLLGDLSLSYDGSQQKKKAGQDCFREVSHIQKERQALLVPAFQSTLQLGLEDELQGQLNVAFALRRGNPAKTRRGREVREDCWYV